MSFRSILLVAAPIALFFSNLAVAQDAASNGVPQLPQNPAQWINSAAITNVHLKGKGAVLFFFHPQSQKVNEKWGELMKISENYKDQPVVFIAVNSGNPRNPLQLYARRMRIGWPILVDADRAFEKACSLPELKRQDGPQVRLIMPDGNFQLASVSDIDAAASLAVKDAKWNFDPTNVPKTLRSAWQAIEFGDYPKGAALLKRNLKARDEATQTAANELWDYVDEQLKTLLEEAQMMRDNDDLWGAYKVYYDLGEKYKGYDLPKELPTWLKELRKNETVSQELEAYTRYNSARKFATSPAAKNRLRGKKLLEVLSNDLPETEAAQKAIELLIELNSQ